MSEQGRAYRLTDEQIEMINAACSDDGLWVLHEEQEAIEAALSAPVPTAQELLDAIIADAFIDSDGYVHTNWTEIRRVAAEMGLTIDEEQGDA